MRCIYSVYLFGPCQASVTQLEQEWDREQENKAKVLQTVSYVVYQLQCSCPNIVLSKADTFYVFIFLSVYGNLGAGGQRGIGYGVGPGGYGTGPGSYGAGPGGYGAGPGGYGAGPGGYGVGPGGYGGRGIGSGPGSAGTLGVGTGGLGGGVGGGVGAGPGGIGGGLGGYGGGVGPDGKLTTEN